MYTFDLLTEQEVKKRVFDKTHQKLTKHEKLDSNSILFPEIETSLEERLRHMFNINVAQISIPHKRFYEVVKRFLDLTFCILFSPIAIILIGIFSVFIKLNSKGPSIYKQTRSGKNGKIFTIYKLRSMVSNAEKASGATWAVKDDPRITSVGKFIRQTRIDELPQLWNIFIGEMSFIGPRPERPELIIEFSVDHPSFITRNAIKPGITGWAQINGGYELTPGEKIKYDLYYIKKRGFAFDLFILFKTIGVVFTGNGAY